MGNYEGTCKEICSYNLVYNLLIQLLPLKSSVFVVLFSNAFWHRNKASPKGSFQNGIVPLLVIFHLSYSNYRGTVMCFHSCRYQNQIFLLLSHLCCSCSTCVALVPHSCCSCLTRVALVLHLCHSCRSCRSHVACVWHSYRKLDQIEAWCSNSEIINSSYFDIINYKAIPFEKKTNRKNLSLSDKDKEILTIEIISKEGKNILLSCCYKPPKGIMENCLFCFNMSGSTKLEKEDVYNWRL